jgi:oligopeptide transport system permease protein
MPAAYEMNPELFEPIELIDPVRPMPKNRLSAWQKFMKQPLAVSCVAILFLIVVGAAIGPYISGHEFDQANLPLRNHAPSWDFWFGSDDLGRDIFTRVWYGARISLFIGFTAAFIDMIIGVTWGATSAFLGGIFDNIGMRICDILFSLPKLLVVMVLTLAIGTGLLPIIIAIAVIGWVPMARIVRGEVLSIKEQDYILSGVALGLSYPRLLTKYLIPNAMGPIAVAATMNIPKVIFVEAFLSFVGLGVQAPHASWGTMAHEALPAMIYYPWRMFFPAALMSLTIICFNFIGDGLQKVLK